MKRFMVGLVIGLVVGAWLGWQLYSGIKRSPLGWMIQ